MEGWIELSLKEIGWFRGAGVNKLLSPEEQSVYLINYMDVYTHWRIYFNTRYQLVTAKKREIEEANLLVGDILFTPSSEKPIDIGHAGVVMEDMPNCLYSYHLIRYRLFDRNKFDLTYLSYLLNSDEVQKHFVSRASGSGIRYTLSLNDFRSVKIRVPEKAVQIKIANILSKVDEAIESVQNSIVAAERLKKSLMQNLLTGKMKPDGTFRTPEEFYSDDKFGQVPIGWQIKKVNDLFYLNQNVLPNRTDPSYRFRYITIESVNTESINFDNCDEFTFNESPGRARRIIKDGDILISGVRPNLKAFAIYRRPDTNNWICSTGFHVLTAKENVCPQFFFYQILSSIGASQFHSWVSGSNYPAIGDNDMRKMKLYVPPYEEQLSINHCIECLIKIQIEKQTEIKTLMSLRKSLLQHLLLGVYQVIK